MSQVKNLLAIFEQKGDASPPDRGRVQTLDQAEASRPLSRVRASFIAVEKDGRVGLQRDPSADSLLSTTQKTSTPEGESWTPARKQPVSPPSVQPIQIDVESKPSTPAKRTMQAAGSSRPVQTPKQPAPMFAPIEVARAAEPQTPVAEAMSVPKPTPLATPKVQTIEVEKALPPTPVVAAGEKADKRKIQEKTPVEPVVNTREASKEEKVSTDSPDKTAAIANPAIPAERQPSPEEKKIDLEVPAVVAQQEQTHTDANVSSEAAESATKAASPSEAAAKTTKPERTATSPSGIPTRTKAPKSTSATKNTPSVVAAKKSTKNNAPKSITTTKVSVKPALKTPTSPAKPLTPRLAAFTPETKTPVVAEKSGDAATPKSAASSTVDRSTAPSSAKKLLTVNTAFPPNGIGFVKPKPKSPTRPVQLPPGLMTHTASSATKINMPRQSLSRLSGNVNSTSLNHASVNHASLNHAPYQVVSRSPSRVSISSVATTKTTTKTLKRQSSTIGRTRPSFGPPPKQPARDHPVPKKEKVVDESFLARMMRPTQASALKTADRVHQSQKHQSQKKATTTVKKSGLPRAIGSKTNGTPAQPAKENEAVAVTEEAEEKENIRRPVEEEAVVSTEEPEELPVNQDVSKANCSEEKTLGDVDEGNAAKETETDNGVVAVEN